MENSILSSPVLREHKPGDMWRTPVRSAVRSIKRDGKSYSKIFLKTSVLKSLVRRIVKGKSSRITRKGKACKRLLLKQADIQRIFRFVSQSWANCTKSQARIKAKLFLPASTTTIRKTIKKHGYRRCVACRRLFISKN